MPEVTMSVLDRVATITIDRPPVNALAAPTYRQLTTAFDSVADRRDVSAVVLRAEGDRAFCAGADLNDSARKYARREVADGDTVVDSLDPGATARDCFRSIYDCAVPVIAAVQGPALGAGLALIACADIVIAAEEATFGLPEMLVGVLGGGRFLQRMVSPQAARHMYYTGRAVTARDFHRLGALHSVVPRSALDATALELADEIAEKSPIALRLGKESLNRAEDLALMEGYHVEQGYTARVSTFDDAREARESWREKRPPVWKWQ